MLKSGPDVSRNKGILYFPVILFQTSDFAVLLAFVTPHDVVNSTRKHIYTSLVLSTENVYIYR